MLVLREDQWRFVCHALTGSGSLQTRSGPSPTMDPRERGLNRPRSGARRHSGFVGAERGDHDETARNVSWQSGWPSIAAACLLRPLVQPPGGKCLTGPMRPRAEDRLEFWERSGPAAGNSRRAEWPGCRPLPRLHLLGHLQDYVVPPDQDDPPARRVGKTEKVRVFMISPGWTTIDDALSKGLEIWLETDYGVDLRCAGTPTQRRPHLRGRAGGLGPSKPSPPETGTRSSGRCGTSRTSAQRRRG